MEFSESELDTVKMILHKVKELDLALKNRNNAINLGDIVIWQDGTELGDIKLSEVGGELVFIPRKLN